MPTSAEQERAAVVDWLRTSSEKIYASPRKRDWGLTWRYIVALLFWPDNIFVAHLRATADAIEKGVHLRLEHHGGGE